MDILLRWPKGKAWSTMRWPMEQPTNLDMRLWNSAMKSICLSRSGTPKVGKYTSDLHRVRRWFWNKTDSSIHHVYLDGTTEEVYVVGRKPNRFSYSHSQQRGRHNAICSIQPTLEGKHWQLLSTTTIAPWIPRPHSFVKVLQSWGNYRSKRS